MLDIKHIWWDLDGTLYKMPPEFERLKYEKRYQLFSEVTEKPITDALREEYQRLYEECGSHSAVFMRLGKPKDFWQNEHQQLDLMPYINPDPRTVDMFMRFGRLPFAHSVFTNRKQEYIHKILGHLKIDYSLFKNIITNDDIKNPKPHLEGFERMIKVSGVPASQILYVGDRVEADILPAKQVGMKTALVWSDKEKTEADYTFPHVAD